MIEQARAWRDRGYVPFPMVYRSKKPRFPWGQWLGSKELPADAVMEAWFRGVWNMGVVLRGSDVVVDFDDMSKYREWRERWSVKALTTFTARGAHVWLRCEADLHGMSVDGADLLRNHLVVVPPSVHPSGVLYELHEGPVPVVDTVPGAVMTGEKRERLVRRSITEATGEDSAIGAIKKLVPIEVYLNRVTKVWLRSDGNGKAICPLHNDHDPSLLIDGRTNRCKCMAGCTDGWIDIIDMRMRLDGIGIDAAIWRFATELGF